MRHFRDVKEIEQHLVDEHLRQGVPVMMRDGMAVVTIAIDDGMAEPARPEINLTIIANVLWEKLS